MAGQDTEIRLIKKYQNRRLYDTAESRYIALNDILSLVRRGISFQVVDAKTNEDLTRSVLIQIILEQESGETPLFTTPMLEDFIRHYDEETREVFSEYLERNFELFAEQQKVFQQQMDKFTGINPLNRMTSIAQSNIDFWQNVQSNFWKSTGFYGNKKDK